MHEARGVAVGQERALTRWLSRWAPASALALLVAHLALRPVAETDLFFHLAAGREALRGGALVHRNLFSFTFPEAAYLDSAWLFDLGAARLERAGGFAALVLVKAALLLATFLAAFALARRQGAGPGVAAFALGAAAFVVEPRMVERPHLFSFGFEIALLALLDLAATRPRWLWGAPALVALWANCHAGAFLGPLLLAASAVGAAIDARGAAVGAGAPPGPRAAALALAALAGSAALLLTPVGAGIFRYLAFHVDLQALHAIDEFRRPDLVSDGPLCAALLGGSAALVGFPKRVPVAWRWALPGLALAALALRSVRFGADFALVTAPLAAARISALLAKRSARGGLARRPSARLAPVLTWAAVPAVALGVGLARVTERVPQRPLVDLGLAADVVPLTAIDFVERAGLGDRMYNDLELGGYLAWRWFPGRRVFVDPRLPAYPRAFHALLGRADLTRADWDAALAGFGVDSALIAYAGVNRRVAWWDPARWALVFRGGDARVFVRRLPKWRALIAAHEIPASFAFAEATGTRTLPLERPPVGSPVAACEWQLRLGDLLYELDGGDDRRALAAYAEALLAPSATACLPAGRIAPAAAWLGAALLGHQRPALALPALDRALAAGGEGDSLRGNRALALQALGRDVEAAAAWRALAAATQDAALAARAGQRAAALAGAR